MKSYWTMWQMRVMRMKSRPSLAWLRLRGGQAGQGCVVTGVDFPWAARGIRIGAGVLIVAGSVLCIPAGSGGSITIGDRTGIGRTSIYAAALVHIGKDCLFSDGVHISDSEHILGRGIAPISSGLRLRGTVAIGDRCFVGRNVTILPGTLLGCDCVVGAGAVVSGAWPDGSVLGGVPARLIKTL